MRPLLVPILSLSISSVFMLRQDQTPTFRTGVADVQVNPEVSENGRPIENLKQSDFLIYDDDQVQPAVYFAHESVPLDLVLLLDVSGSVRKYFREMGAMAGQALSRLEVNDRVAVMLFSRDIWIEQAFTSDHDEIAEAIGKASSEAPPGSGTRIYAAVQSAARYLIAQHSNEVRRRATLIITDNDGISYDVHQDQALRSLFDGAITLDAIVAGRHPHPPVPPSGATINPDFAFDDVFPLAEHTGGEAIATMKPKESLANILGRIRERYLLIYHVPGGAQAGSFHHVRVDLAPETKQKHPHALVRARRGYYVNGPAPPEGTVR